MSDDTPINDSDQFIAKKRLARELRKYVIGQAVALFAATLGALPFFTGVMQNDPKLDAVYAFAWILCGAGVLVSIVLAFWVCYKLWLAVFLPIAIRIYGLVGYTFVVFFVILYPLGFVALHIGLGTLFLGSPVYGLIPQCFIVRWLAKEVENDAIPAVGSNNDLIE